MAKDKSPEAQQEKPAEVPISFSGQLDEFGRPLFEIDPQPRQAGAYNAADEKQIEAARKEAGQRKREDADFWRIAMSTPVRRASFYRLLESCSIFTEPADLGTATQPSDPLRTYRNLGRQSIGKEMMLAAMDASLDLYLQMVREHKEAEDRRSRRADKGSKDAG